MKLVDYVFEKANEVDRIEVMASHYDIKAKDYITTGYCPSAFKILSNTPYEKPYSPEKNDKNSCKFLNGDNEKKCLECWNREVLVFER